MSPEILKHWNLSLGGNCARAIPAALVANATTAYLRATSSNIERGDRGGRCFRRADLAITASTTGWPLAAAAAVPTATIFTSTTATSATPTSFARTSTDCTRLGFLFVDHGLARIGQAYERKPLHDAPHNTDVSPRYICRHWDADDFEFVVV